MQKSTAIINAVPVILEVIDRFTDNEAGDPTALAEIEARYDAFIEALRIEQQTILRYFEMQFAERAEALGHFYDLLDRARDKEQLEVAVSGIVGIIRENPLLGYAEFRKAIGDPTQKIEL